MAKRWDVLCAALLGCVSGAASPDAAAPEARPAVPPAAEGEIDRLVKDLDDDAFETRQAAFGRLARLAKAFPKETVAALPKEAATEEVGARLQELRDLAAGERPPRRPPAGKVWTQLGASGAGPDGAYTFSGEVRVFEANILAGAAAPEVGPMAEILQSILEDLEDADPEVRAKSVKNVGKVGGAKPRKVLREGIGQILDCSDADVRRSAVQALAKLARKKWPDDDKGLEAARAWLKEDAALDEEEE